MSDRHLWRLGARVKQMRLERGWTVADLGQRCRMHPGYLRSIEQGERPVSFENLTLIAHAFGVRLDELLEPVISGDPDPGNGDGKHDGSDHDGSDPSGQMP